MTTRGFAGVVGLDGVAGVVPPAPDVDFSDPDEEPVPEELELFAAPVEIPLEVSFFPLAAA